MADEKELQQLKKRLLELAGRSYEHGIYTFTPFLGLSEQQAFYEIQRDLAYAGTGMEGGSPLCERKMIRFGAAENLGYEEPYPIACLKVEPVMPKFAEQLTHRDFPGCDHESGNRAEHGRRYIRAGKGGRRVLSGQYGALSYQTTDTGTAYPGKMCRDGGGDGA